MQTILKGYKKGGSQKLYSVYHIETDSYLTDWLKDRHQAKRFLMVAERIENKHCELHFIIK